MGAIRTTANAAFRDFVTDGVPASGVHEPVKSEARATFGAVEDAVDTATAIANSAAAGRTALAAVRVRSTANVDISTALENGDTLNGVTLATGDRVFLGSQSTASQNGIYVVVASGAASRATDADTAAELARCEFTVLAGTVGAGETWHLPLASSAITVGTTALNFVQTGVEISYASEINARLDLLPEVFTAAATDDYAKTVFREISIEYGEPGHVYYLNYRTHFDGATYKIWLQLENATRNQTVAVLERQGASAAAVKAKFEDGYAYLTLVSLGNPLPTPAYDDYVGTAALVKMDLDAIDWTKSQTAYTAATQTAIRPENVHSWSEMLADWMGGARPKVVLTVGATGCDFTTVRGAVESLHDPDLAGSIVSSSWPISNLVSWSRQVMIHVVDASYTENLAGLILPHFVIIRGQGKGNTVLTATGTAGPDLPRVFEANHSCRFECMTIRQNGAGYAVHHDILNSLTKRAINNPRVQLYRIWQFYFDVRVEAATGNAAPMLGVGLSNGHWLYCEATDFIREGTGTTEMVYVHNSPDNTEPGVLWFKNCRSNDASITSSNGFLILGTTYAQTTSKHTVMIENTVAGNVGRTNTSGGAEAFVRQGLWTGITNASQLNPS
jgi:hypothetical protein